MTDSFLWCVGVVGRAGDSGFPPRSRAQELEAALTGVLQSAGQQARQQAARRPQRIDYLDMLRRP